MKVVFLFNFSPEVGGGHFKRCSNLALKFLENNAKVFFITNEHNVLKARNKLKKDGRVTIHRIDFCDYKQPISYDFILNMIPCNPIIYPLDIIWKKVLLFSKEQGIIVTLPYCGNIMKLIPSNKYHYQIFKRWFYYNNIINKYKVSTRLSLINIPPCYVICLKT